MVPHTIPIISLFTGGAGLDLAVDLALRILGFEPRTLAYCEREGYAQAVLVARVEDKALGDAPGWNDVANFPSDLFRPYMAGGLVIGGFPCQGSSVAGKRLMADDPRHLWPAFWRVVRKVGASWLFLENVPGFAIPNRAEGRDAPAWGVLADLAEGGWSAEWVHLSSGACGGSHKRERFWLLACDRARMGDAANIGHHGGKVDDDLANRDSSPGERRRDGAVRGELGRSDAVVGDTADDGHDGCCKDSQEPRRGLLQPTGTISTLGDSGSGRRRVHKPKRGPQRRTVTEWTGAELADAKGPRREGAEPAGGVWPDGLPAEHGRELPLFPPRPGDLDAWREVLAEHPELAPAIESRVRGMADELAAGMEHRQDRLRLLGNGVDPVAGATALLHLFARIRER